MNNATRVQEAKEPKKPVKLFQLYVADADDDNGFTPSEPLPDTLMQIKMMIELDEVSEYHQGMYFALQEVLSCPVGLLHDKIVELLNDIIDESLDLEEEDDDMTKRHSCGFVPNDNLKGEVATLEKQDDITDEELMAEYDNKPEHLHED